MTQADMILQHMREKGPITPIQALQLYGCFRLAARISELKERGISISTEVASGDNGKHWARYSLHQKHGEQGTLFRVFSEEDWK